MIIIINDNNKDNSFVFWFFIFDFAIFLVLPVLSVY